MATMKSDIDPTEFVQGLYGEVPEIMHELWSRMPLGQEITLSNGRVCKIVKFIEPRLREGQGWEFGFDVRFEVGSPDHLEFMVKHTGGGGMVGVAPTPIAQISRS